MTTLRTFYAIRDIRHSVYNSGRLYFVSSPIFCVSFLFHVWSNPGWQSCHLGESFMHHVHVDAIGRWQSISRLLRDADYFMAAGSPRIAIDYLSLAREYARGGDTQRCRAVAAHCTAAIQALLPVSLEDML